MQNGTIFNRPTLHASVEAFRLSLEHTGQHATEPLLVWKKSPVEHWVVGGCNRFEGWTAA